MHPRKIHPTAARLRALFSQGLKLTCRDAAVRLFLTPRNTHEYMKTLAAAGEIHVCELRRLPKGRPTPVYCAVDVDERIPKRAKSKRAKPVPVPAIDPLHAALVTPI